MSIVLHLYIGAGGTRFDNIAGKHGMFSVRFHCSSVFFLIIEASLTKMVSLL